MPQVQERTESIKKAYRKDGSNMNEKVIKLADVEEVCDFVRAAGMCDFDIDICDQRMIIDAKSILGVMGLGIMNELTVKYGGEDMAFENVLSKYAVA